ncbi:FadR family transcriptional regulator [Actinospica durhamensis]|uniref:FadR family transcriptional regulator n=1 Tax=Actinospica durhamensis TaxID=1508375 RepID=A0A941IR66_9ACTN|nr:GntR family transcriptional regulator [Actinospica durhamensis]MBR7834972.1 FadR family transcriptional regulator [Actinospica durhamensis]
MYVEGWNAHRVVRPSRLANAVIERLLLRILDGEFQPGGDLPPEAALAQEFAVSRTILREALKALEEKRVLRIRHGRGTTVRPKNEWNILDPMVLTVLLEYGGSSTLATELDEVRTALQGLMADLAAQRITPEQRRDLDLCLNRMRAALPVEPGIGDPLAYREAAHLFARVLSEAAGNEVARCVVETIDVPLRDEDPEHLQGVIPRTQEFAERLYARVVGLPAPDEQMVDLAEPSSGAGSAPVSLPSQPPVLTTPLRRRPMVGVSR